MTFARKLNRHNKYYKRRFTRRKPTSAAGIARKALSKANRAYALAKPEYKYFDLSELNVNVDYNGYLPSIALPAQGDSDSNRSGDRIKIANLTLRYKCARNGADAPVRVMIVFDKQCKVTSGSDILEQVGAFATATRSPKNYDKRFQTQILYDKVHQVTTNNPIVEGKAILKINKYTQFNLGTTTPTSGRLFLFLISDINANTPQISYYSRITYTDN